MPLLLALIIGVFVVAASQLGVFTGGGGINSASKSNKPFSQTANLPNNPISLDWISKDKLPNIRARLSPTPKAITSPSPQVSASLSPSATPGVSTSSSPSVVPTPSSSPTPAYCKSNTKTANGKLVLNVAWASNDIQKTIDCFKDPSTGGGAVYIPAGSYVVSEKIRVYSNVTVFGEGIDQTIITLDGSKNDVVMSNDSSKGQSNIVIRDLTLKGLGQKPLVQGACCNTLELDNLTKGYIINVAALDAGLDSIYLGYKIKNGVPQGVNDVRVSGCRARGGSRMQFSIIHGNNLVVDNCEIDGSGTDGWSGIDLEPDSTDTKVSNSKIVSNNVRNSNWGININGASGESKDPNTVSDNAICYNKISDIGCGGIGDTGVRNVIIGNEIKNVGCGRGDDSRNSLHAPESACQIPSSLATLPERPPTPGAVQGTSTQGNYSGNLLDNILSGIENLVGFLVKR